MQPLEMEILPTKHGGRLPNAWDMRLNPRQLANTKHALCPYGLPLLVTTLVMVGIGGIIPECQHFLC